MHKKKLFLSLSLCISLSPLGAFIRTTVSWFLFSYKGILRNNPPFFCYSVTCSLYMSPGTISLANYFPLKQLVWVTFSSLVICCLCCPKGQHNPESPDNILDSLSGLSNLQQPTRESHKFPTSHMTAWALYGEIESQNHSLSNNRLTLVVSFWERSHISPIIGHNIWPQKWRQPQKWSGLKNEGNLKNKKVLKN